MMAGSKKVFATLGSSNHVPEEREAFDYYATDPKAVEMLWKCCWNWNSLPR